MPISLSQLRKTFDDKLYDAAQRLVESGGVCNVRILQSGSVVTGIAANHRVYIRCTSGPHPNDLEGECSCRERAPCVHVAAVLVATQNNRAAIAIPSPQPINKAAPPASPGQQQRLYYLIDFAGAGSAGGFQLSVWVGQTSADGRQIQPDSVCAFSPRSSTGAEGNAALPRYVNFTDRDILKRLAAWHSDGPWELHDAAGAELLQQTIATGRAYWQSLRGAPLQLDELRGVDWIARSSDNEKVPAPQAVTQAVTKEPLSSLKARLLLSADLKATLHFVYSGVCIDSRSLRFNALHADRDTVRYRSGDLVYEAVRDRPAERELHDRFNRVLATISQDRESWLTFITDTVPALQAQGWEIDVDERFPYRVAATGNWYADLQTDATAATPKGSPKEWFDLRLGIRVDGHPVNLLPALTAWLQNAIDKHHAAYCCIGEQLFVRLDDGRWLPVAIERIRRIADTLVELFDRDGLDKRETLSLPLSQAGRLALLTDELHRSGGGSSNDNPFALSSNDRTLLALIEDLKNFSGIAPLSAPEHFQATLRPYQQEGLGWLQFLRRYRLGGILADDMGLGKTVQTLAHLAIEKEEGRLHKPSLIVAPVSVIGNWQQELNRFAPEFKVLVLHGARRKELFASIDRADIVITAYPLLLIDSEILLAREFCFVILDEAQTIKNPRAKVSQCARALRADYRLCLTGTPMENHLGELWSLFDFVQPGFLGNETAFQRHYRTPIEKNGSKNRSQALARRIAPFVLRRTKDAVAKDLPPKTQIVESIVLDERQRDFYDSIRLAMHARVREAIAQQGLARSHITVLDALLKLRQACCDPRLITAAAETPAIPPSGPPIPSATQTILSGTPAVPSAKLDWLLTALPELVEEGRRILLFSQFTSMLRIIETAVTELKIPYLKLTGKTQNRTELVNRFQSGAVPLFLISLKAGGAGLNLTAADTVIHYDPWWNPAVEAQATDRAHRIGQDKPVFVYKLIAQGTVEEKIMQLQAGKHALASLLYTEQNASPARLSAADLEALFAA